MSQKDVRMHFEHTELSGIFTSCGNLDLDSHQHKCKNTRVVLSFRWSERWEGVTGRKEEEASTWLDPNLPTCRSWRGGSGRSFPPKSSRPQPSDGRTGPKTSRSWTCDKTRRASMETKLFSSFLEKKGLYMEDLWPLILGNQAINGMKRHGWPSLSIQSGIKIRSSHQMDRQRLNSALWFVNLFCFFGQSSMSTWTPSRQWGCCSQWICQRLGLNPSHSSCLSFLEAGNTLSTLSNAILVQPKNNRQYHFKKQSSSVILTPYGLRFPPFLGLIRFLCHLCN